MNENPIGILGSGSKITYSMLYNLTAPLIKFDIKRGITTLELTGSYKLSDNFDFENISISKRRLEVAYLTIRGKSAKEIGRILGVSPPSY